MARATSQIYDVASLHSSVLISCPSMVRGQQDTPRLHGNSMEGQAPKPQPTQPRKKRPEDFRFGKILGEGSFSTVVLAKEHSTGKEYAIKILEKRHIMKENKAQYVKRERDIMSHLDHPFFVKLYFTFQDEEKLYFGLSYAKNGELLKYIRKIGSFDETCTRFYSAEIVCALEYLHQKGIIHRDLKPENVLLSEEMHIQITDFGTAKQLNEYLIFQKIIKLEYEFPEKFFPKAKDLVEQLLSLEPCKRIGCEEMGGYGPLKSHPFFETVGWDDIHLQTPPKLTAYLPAMSEDDEDCYGNYDDLLSQFSCMQVAQPGHAPSVPFTGETSQPTYNPSPSVDQFIHIHELDSNSMELDLLYSDEEKRILLDKQGAANPWHQFVENNLILKMGPVDKRKGLFARRRQLLLTEGPHLYYVDPVNKVLKGEIPWSPELRPEAKNFKTFFVHTPNRTYYLMDPSGNADKWCKKIQEVWRKIYHKHQSPSL
uniref:3-phosphoinositide-dependent protein kinase 1 n=1 Tax=Cyprinus carpio carpio TaxID=630221 RepID=A0A8C1A774_CYPCA